VNNAKGMTRPLAAMRRKKTVTIHDRMQKRYRYMLVAAVGRGFDPEFTPELTPAEMLRLGVFCGKYMTDCRKEFPAAWFKKARLSPRARRAPTGRSSMWRWGLRLSTAPMER